MHLFEEVLFDPHVAQSTLPGRMSSTQLSLCVKDGHSLRNWKVRHSGPWGPVEDSRTALLISPLEESWQERMQS